MVEKVAIPEIYFVIPAAGVGSRMGADCPKQYLMLAGKSVLYHTLSLFLSVDAIAGGVVVRSQGDSTPLPLESERLWETIGGETRTESVTAGLQYLANRLSKTGKSLDDVWVLVHDAARPGLKSSELALFCDHLVLTQPEAGLIMAMPAQDTVKRADETGRIIRTEDRSTLWLAQTPQAAKLGVLLNASEKILRDGVNVTDEASILEYNGLFPQLYRGYSHNLKITYPEDLELMRLYFTAREV